ncbi:MAG: LacI family transcriptional regulator [Bacteroidetes bacterium]|nr:MAG: LacI family transcriptional regulator [Bacteroidota bacterium]
MKKHRVTIKDIARILNISPSTVSYALNDHPNINPNTKKSIKDLAKELNYKPNKVALSLLQNESKIIGLIIPEIIHHFFSTVISGIEQVANKAGYHVMICQSNESYEREVENVQALLSSNIDGFIISMSKNTHKNDHFKNIENIGVPIVFFDRPSEGIFADRVIVDDFNGAFQAVKHLIENGSKYIVHLAGPQHLKIGENRKLGYIKAHEHFNMKVSEDYIKVCDTYDQANEFIPELIKKHPEIDGIFAVNDLTAIGSIKALKKINKKVPDDIAVCGFTNSFVSRMTDFELSTVDQKGFEMGQVAVKLLLDRMRSEEKYDPVTKVLKTELLIRDSSKK